MKKPKRQEDTPERLLLDAVHHHVLAHLTPKEREIDDATCWVFQGTPEVGLTVYLKGHPHVQVPFTLEKKYRNAWQIVAGGDRDMVRFQWLEE